MSHLDFSNLTVDSIQSIIDDFINKIKIFNEEQLKINNESLSWNSYIQPSINFFNSFRDKLAMLNMSSFHTNKEIRDKCVECETTLSQFMIEDSMRKDLFEQFKYYYNNQFQEEKKTFSQDRIKYIEDSMMNYRINGLELIEEKYNKVKEIKKELTKLSNNYSQNLTNYDKNFILTKEDLVGLKDNWLQSRINTDGTYNVTLKYPDYVPVMEFCSNRATRKMFYTEYMKRCCDENKPIVNVIFKLRHELGLLFDFDLFSDYQLQKRMAKNTTNVMNFLNDLKDKIKPSISHDFDNLLSISKEDGLTEREQLEGYDIAYYSRIYTEKESELDMEELRKYFPLNNVMNGMFSIYETLLGFKFIDITEQNKDKFWHEDVKLYQVLNSVDNSEQGQFYLDLHPRSGKYGHAAVFPIQRGSIKNIPVCIMACNFPKTENLSFDDVQTFFHEFGHVMHTIASRPELSSQAGTAVARDAVECPSQMLEEWCYRSEPLKLMAPEITDEIINKLIKQKNMLQGLYYTRQLCFSFLDMKLHGKSYDCDYNQLFSDIYNDLLGIKLPENHGFVQTFEHLMGYQAGYYGYLYSKSFAVCMFEEKFKNHELDPIIGMEYRKKIIAPGNTREFMDLMIDFLGHPPTNDAFINSLIN